MEQMSDTKILNVLQQERLKKLQAELETIDSKFKSDGKVMVEDGAFINNLGWICMSSLAIGSITMGSIGAIL
jgi:hypothetical protein